MSEKYHWVAFRKGMEVARGATPDEALGLALIGGYKESEILIKCVMEMPER